MSGEFTNGQSHDRINTVEKQSAQTEDPNKVPTDVEGVFANGLKDNAPVFDCEKTDFFNNMKLDRKRLRFKPDSPISKYMQGTKYNRPFWLRHEGYLRKVK